jgi:hypothetical protein
MNVNDWWGHTILNEQPQTNLFRCPSFKARRIDLGVRWEWNFDAHKVGYGYNGFFLGHHPYGSATVLWVDVTPQFKRSAVVNPTMNLVVGDSMPKPNGNWSSSLWWPQAGMKQGDTLEGIDPNRHDGLGVVVFNDGHAEARKDDQINPPHDPIRTRTAVNSEHWDPMQREPQRRQRR